MTITRHKIKGCCGSLVYVFDMDKPIKKTQIQIFKDANYSVPQNFQTLGIFYVAMGSLIATSSFGAKSINIKCFGANCNKLLDDFAIILETAISS